MRSPKSLPVRPLRHNSPLTLPPLDLFHPRHEILFNGKTHGRGIEPLVLEVLPELDVFLLNTVLV